MKAFAALFFLSICLLTGAARAATIDVYDNHGGVVRDYDQKWAGLAAQGDSVRIVGPCQSACTILLGHIPRNRICVTSQASFGFHLAAFPRSTAMLWNAYQPDIKAWITAHGGLKTSFMWMRAPDTYRFFRRC